MVRRRPIATLALTIAAASAPPPTSAEEPPPLGPEAPHSTDALRLLPIEARFLDGAIDLAAGVTMPGAPAPFTLAGGAQWESRYRLDGLDVTSPVTGRLGTAPPLELLADFAVRLRRDGADDGGGLGGYLSMRTGPGGEAWRARAWLHVTPLSLESPASQQRSVVLAPHTDWLVDVGAQAEGPLVKDRLFVHVGLAPQLGAVTTRRLVRRRLADGLPEDQMSGEYAGDLGPNGYATAAVDEAESRTVARSFRFGALARLDAVLRPGTVLTALYLGTPSRRSAAALGPAAGGDGSRLADDEQVAHDALLRLDARILERRLRVEMLLGAHVEQASLRPADPAGGAPLLRDARAGILTTYEAIAACEPRVVHGVAFDPCPEPAYRSGGWGETGESTALRLSGSTRFTFVGELLGRHELRAGLEVQGERYERQSALTGGAAYTIDPEGNVFRSQRVVVVGREVLVQPAGVTSLTSGFSESLHVSDTWHPSFLPSLAAQAGVRWDAQQLRDGQGRMRLALLDGVAPRAGLAWDFLGRGRSRLFVSYAIDYQRLPLAFADALWGSVRTATVQGTCRAAGRAHLDPAACGFPATSTFDVERKPTAEAAPRVGAPWDHEVAAGVDVAPGWDAAIGVTWVRRERGRHLLLREDVTPATLANESSPTSSAPAFEVSPTRLDQVVVHADKRLSHHLALTGAYTYTRTLEGTVGALGTVLGERRSPAPHTLTLGTATAWDLGRGAITVGARLRLHSGQPIDVRGVGPEGETSIFILPRGAGGRTPTLTTLDLHAAYRHPLGGASSIELVADVFNVLDAHAITAIDDVYTYDQVRPVPGGLSSELQNLTNTSGAPARRNPGFGQPLAYQPPLSLRLGLRATF